MSACRATRMVLALPVLALTVASLPAAGADDAAQQAHSGAGVVKASWEVKKDILKYLTWAVDPDAHDYAFRLSRSNHRYAIGWFRNANGGWIVMRRSPGGRWTEISVGATETGVCKVRHLREAGIPRSVRRDFVTATFCYR